MGGIESLEKLPVNQPKHDMQQPEDEIVIPVVEERLHVDTVPVKTGSVRVTKRTVTHDQLVEQTLNRQNAKVERVKVHRQVDGPQTVREEGNLLIIPVTEEVLRIESQWFVTEEIHITRVKESELHQERMSVRRDEVMVEHLDKAGE